MNNHTRVATVTAIVLTVALTISCSLFHEDRTETLIKAAEKGDLRQVETILDRGPDPNAKGHAGYTALIAAVSFGRRPDVMNLLLERGADINTRTRNGNTPLLVAIESYQPNMARLLLEKGADRNVREPQRNSSPLMLSARNNMGDITKLLLDGGANINEEDDYHWSALFWSVHGGHVEMVKLLLDNGADANATTPHGRTALMEAAAPDHLMKTIASENGQDKVVQWGPIYPDRARDVEVVELLLDHGADVNAKDKEGWTALKRAQDRGHKQIVELLKAHGAMK